MIKKFLEVVIKKGKEKASIKAEENLKKIREIVGFLCNINISNDTN